MGSFIAGHALPCITCRMPRPPRATAQGRRVRAAACRLPAIGAPGACWISWLPAEHDMMTDEKPPSRPPPVPSLVRRRPRRAAGQAGGAQPRAGGHRGPGGGCAAGLHCHQHCVPAGGAGLWCAEAEAGDCGVWRRWPGGVERGKGGGCNFARAEVTSMSQQ